VNGHVDVEDLGSTCGTTVNGREIHERTPLRNGDTVAFGTVVMRFDVPPAQVAPTIRPPGPVAQLNMVGGNQYNSYAQAVVMQRDGFLREIAATRTRARRLVWFGVALLIIGTALFAAPLLRAFAAADKSGHGETLALFSIKEFPFS